MARHIKIWLYLLGGIAAVAWAFLIPSHLRAVDADVITRVSKGSRTLEAVGLNFLSLQKPQVADMHLQAAAKVGDQQTNALHAALLKEREAGGTNLISNHVVARPFLSGLLPEIPASGQNEPFLGLILPKARREILHSRLEYARNPAARAVLQTRNLTNTTVFPPARSASGQPLDATLLATALLFEVGGANQALQDEVLMSAKSALSTNKISQLEGFYLDVFTLAKRLDWSQLTEFMTVIPNMATLDQLVAPIRGNEDRLPVVYAAVLMTREPGKVASYLGKYSKTGFADISFALKTGSLGLTELLKRNQQVHHPKFRPKVTSTKLGDTIYYPLVHLATNTQTIALILKFELILLGGFLLARGFHLFRIPNYFRNGYVNVPEFGLARQGLFAVLFLMVMVVFGEPYLAQGNQPKEPPKLWNFSTIVKTVAAGAKQPPKAVMDQYTLVALGLFLVLQGIIYAVCLMKLAEIKRQQLPSSTKLKLLENEENLFDSGLYVGFAGTAASLVLAAFKIISPSLMAAYSSTLFGILFVAILKIFNVRPFRKQLILDVEPVTK